MGWNEIFFYQVSKIFSQCISYTFALGTDETQFANVFFMFLKTLIAELVVESEIPKRLFKVLSLKLEMNNAAKCK